VRTLVLRVPDWPGHRPGQHVDIRLTAPDGYQAQRSYSIATPVDGERVEVGVERLDDGEVSPYLNGVIEPGEPLELRGPIGGHFVWEAEHATGPVLLVGGGSGMVPLMAMVRARGSVGVPMRLLLSARTEADVIYRSELQARAAEHNGFELFPTLTRAGPEGWTGYRRRVDAAMLAEVAWPPEERPRIYICGPTGFVEVVARALVAAGHDPTLIRTERFGPTGS
jgi:ferredoxin-NADP reductase